MKKRGRKSLREHKLAVNAALRYYGVPLENEIKPKRERKPRIGPSEHQEQAAVIEWWWHASARYGLPVFALFAVPNGGARDPIVGAKLKAEGVRKGALDLILARPTEKYHGLFLEMKVGSNKPTENQEAFIAYLRSAGYWASVHWNADTAIKEIEAYLA